MSQRVWAAVVLAGALVVGGTATAVAGSGAGSWMRPMHDGSMPAGSMHGGSMHGGSMHDGSMPAGSMHGGSMHMRMVQSEFEYLAHMVAHHEEAVTASRQLARSSRPEMRQLGASIVTTQTAEITQMKGWLASWYPGRQSTVTYVPMMRDLSALTGDALDRAFLEDMIPHHMMAVMMSQQLLGSDRVTHPQVGTLARTISTAQRAEIRQMRQWLVTWFDGARTWGHLPGPMGMMRG